MKILVQKFGGTSLITEKSRHYVIDHIKNGIKKHKKVIVIVSALGRKPSPYATDTLLSLVNYPNHHTSNRELDLLMSTGEIISSVVLSNELKKQDVSTIAMTGSQAGIITTDEYTNAKIKHIHHSNLISKLELYDVIVVAGFQGETISREMTTLGRGGSDITASAIAAAVHAERIEIYTDVMGVMTADPKVVPRARPIKVANYHEMKNLAYQGAKVIHPRAIEIAMKEQIPIKIKSTYLKDSGTIITTNQKKKQFDINEQFITGITYKRDLSQFQINLKEKETTLQTEIFKSISQKSITVDFIYISPTKLTFTIPKENTKQVKDILSLLNIHPKITFNCSKISIVGMDVSANNLVISTIVESLTDEGISILQSADQYTSLSLLIDNEDLFKALNNLHNALCLNNNYLKKRGEII